MDAYKKEKKMLNTFAGYMYQWVGSMCVRDRVCEGHENWIKKGKKRTQLASLVWDASKKSWHVVYVDPCWPWMHCFEHSSEFGKGYYSYVHERAYYFNLLSLKGTGSCTSEEGWKPEMYYNMKF